ncbi:hypothetical protein [Streptomyces sp. NPDC127084]|uniref:hypothetical protein n=1 Tax=Streptomyces sp. NPDC127084 TaxID=3347133 RepID=UPI0036514604
MLIINLIVRSRWSSYSGERDAISALGETKCGTFNGVHICSPWHEASNISWVVAGFCLTIGACCNARYWPASKVRNLGLIAVAGSGASLVSVGVNPRNVRKAAHLLSADATIVLGVIGVFCLGLAFIRLGYSVWGSIGMACGIGGLLSSACVKIYSLKAFHGWFERLAIWPGLFWLMITGSLIVYKAVTTPRQASEKRY